MKIITELPQGFALYTGNYDTEKYTKNNLLAIVAQQDVFCSAMFTKNTCCGAPITVAKQKLNNPSKRFNTFNGNIQTILVNTNISNVATGAKGIADCTEQSALLAKYLEISEDKVLVSSTGCIGPYLPMKKMRNAIPMLLKYEKQGLEQAANAIMTTDRKEKFISVKCGNSTISGIAKGSGMVAPNMATMLAYIMTDAKISEERFCKIWKNAVEKSFNMVSVDNCESTSDTAIALMNPVFEVDELELENNILEITKILAKKIAYDGEGATKGIEIRVTGAESQESADKIAHKIVSSDLVKTAIFGKDLNWGRIMGAAGSTHLPIDLSQLSCTVGGVAVFTLGNPVLGISKETELSAFDNDEIIITFEMNAGNTESKIKPKFSATAWGCDLTYEYVKINGEYRT